MEQLCIQFPTRAKRTREVVRKARLEYPLRDTKELARELGLTPGSLRKLASDLCVRKDKSGRRKFLESILAEYVTSTAPEIARRYGVTKWCVRKWIKEARAA